MRGGPRPGAGGKKPRLPEDQKRVKLNLVVDPATRDWIKGKAEERRVGQGRVVDELVGNKIKSVDTNSSRSE